MSVLIVIPARMKATRLPNKPLAMIGDAPMIVHVWRRAVEAGIGEVVVACDGEEIATAVRKAGGVAVITDPDLPSGSDRVWSAVASHQSPVASDSTIGAEVPPPVGGRLGGGHYMSPSELITPPPQPSPYGGGSTAQAVRSSVGFPDIIVNLQGDLPTLEPRLLQELLLPLENPAVDITTLVAPIAREEEHENPSVVKAVLSFESRITTRSGAERGAANHESRMGRALYFTRCAAPYGEGARYHHIGVYAYRREALERFVSLPPSPLETREKLEQLRALEAAMRIDAVVVDTVPLGVDTPEDLQRAREMLQ